MAAEKAAEKPYVRGFRRDGDANCEHNAVEVTVPATSANLGPGYDTLGLALGLHDTVSARVVPSGPSLSLSVSGEGASEVADAGEKHLIVRAMRATFDDLGIAQPPGLQLRCVNRIPHGRGLGSSAAAICAGILAARALAGAPAGPDDALPLASGLEGHPDNVAPCLYGGLTVAWLAGESARAVRVEPLETIKPVLLIPDSPVSTEVARGLLPEKVTHADAAANAGRAALLIAALTARPGVLLDATEDRLHQDYRQPAMPATIDLVRRLREAEVPAVVSGAGPSVLCFLRGENSSQEVHPREGNYPQAPPAIGVPTPLGRPAESSTLSAADLGKLDSTAKGTGIDWRITPLDVDRQGAAVSPAASGAW
ncbi:MAG: homoserine kinase [Streptosporangiales bacterium]|nr:homoserine kinase [Streptosporangiales bacterium]